MFFNYVWDDIHTIYFVKGRVSFYNEDGTKGASFGGASNVLLAYGTENAEVLASNALRDVGYDGKFIGFK